MNNKDIKLGDLRIVESITPKLVISDVSYGDLKRMALEFLVEDHEITSQPAEGLKKPSCQDPDFKR